MKYFNYIFFILLVVGTRNLSASPLHDSIPHKVIHRLGLEVHPTYVVPTHRFIKGNNAHNDYIRFAFSGHLKYAFQFPEGSRMNRLYPHAYQGIGAGYNQFIGTSEFGHPMSVYAYQGSQLARLNSKLTFHYEWNFGISFGWNEYDPYTHEKNHVIGTNVDAYMNLSFLFNWQLNPHLFLTTGLGLTHCSNGNTHYPNQGINLLESRIGLVRTFGNEEKMHHTQDAKASLHLPRHMSYDVIVYSGFRVREIMYEGKKYIPHKNFAVAGINFNPMYHFDNNLRAGASLDLQYDESSNLMNYVTGVGDEGVEFNKQPFHERLSAGISLRGEWAMPIFSINGGIGYNFYAKSFDTKKFYQVLAMKIHIVKGFFLHIGYQMNQFKDPNNLMLGAGYRFE